MQTIRGKQGKPFTGNQGQRDFDQKDYYELIKNISTARNYLLLRTAVAQTYDKGTIWWTNMTRMNYKKLM